MDKLKLDKKSLRSFGITMSLALSVIAIVVFLKRYNSNFALQVASGFFLALAVSAPVLLKPLYIIWMKFAFILGWVNTRIILCILFYLFFTPISIGIKIFKIDLLDRSIEKDKDSYWKPKEKTPFNPLNYERQF
ncbi:MAG: SxtJ family membrane protein [Candidatus Omnitrophica bacterium]|nr:SxtJ family membrane protein [Candidatus Omnitrophota bacterium]